LLGPLLTADLRRSLAVARWPVGGGGHGGSEADGSGATGVGGRIVVGRYQDGGNGDG